MSKLKAIEYITKAKEQLSDDLLSVRFCQMARNNLNRALKELEEFKHREININVFKEFEKMKVIPFIINNAHLFTKGFEHCGEANGYVAIPPTNKYYGLPYDSPEVESLSVHGGITFSEFVTLKNTTCNGVHRVKPELVGRRNPLLTENELCFLGDKPIEIPDDWFILGFDTCHLGDNKNKWDEDRVAEETYDLAILLDKGEK